jgi:hypothetical protein
LPSPYSNMGCLLVLGLKAVRPIFAHLGPLKPLLKYDTLSLSNLLIPGPKAPRPIFLNLGRLPTFIEIWDILFMTFANHWSQGSPAHFFVWGPFKSTVKYDTFSSSQIFRLDFRRSERDSLYENIVGPNRDKGSTCRLGVHIIMSTIKVPRLFSYIFFFLRHTVYTKMLWGQKYKWQSSICKLDVHIRMSTVKTPRFSGCLFTSRRGNVHFVVLRDTVYKKCCGARNTNDKVRFVS